MCCFIILFSNISFAETSNFNNINSNTNISNISTKDVKNKNESTSFINSINKLNNFSKQKLKQYNIILTDKRINSYDKYSNKENCVRGLIDYNNNNIVVHNYRYDTEKSLFILYHELGHTLDSYNYTDKFSIIHFERHSNTKEFIDLFNEEGIYLDNFTDEKYFYSKKKESFAETFAIFMTYPNELKKYAPKLYNYMYTIYNKQTKGGWIKDKYNNMSYILKDGNLAKGWFIDNETNEKYYFDNNGIMVKATIIDGILISPSGQAL